jgi:hypothetical protein
MDHLTEALQTEWVSDIHPIKPKRLIKVRAVDGAEGIRFEEIISLVRFPP